MFRVTGLVKLMNRGDIVDKKELKKKIDENLSMVIEFLEEFASEEGEPPEAECDKACKDKTEKTLDISIFKTTQDLEFGVIYGIASKADYFDTQNDNIDLPTLRKAAHEFMIKSRAGNIDHEGGIDGDIVESFIVDKDFIKAIKEGTIEEGSWVIGYRPYDKAIAKAALSGEYVGFSIEGMSRREPVT